MDKNVKICPETGRECTSQDCIRLSLAGTSFFCINLTNEKMQEFGEMLKEIACHRPDYGRFSERNQ